jgi:hypothetical protein
VVPEDPAPAEPVSAAQRDFEQALYEVDALREHRLTGQGEELTQQTKRLFDQLLLVSKKMEAVTQHGDARWSVAALVERADALVFSAGRLREAPTPVDMDPTERDAYIRMIEQNAAKFDAQATAVYCEASELAAKANVDGPYSVRARKGCA